MAKKQMTGLLVNGSVKTAGVSFYTRNGKTVVRTSHSDQPRRNTRAQFAARQRMKHTTALWQQMKWAEPMFEGGSTAYGRFCALANALTTVYTPKRGPLSNAAFLMPGMPVSDGPLPTVEQRLGLADGEPALLTGLTARQLAAGGKWLLYTLRQTSEGMTPHVAVTRRQVARNEFREVDGRMALVDDGFADTDTGWALVRVADGHCSSQTLLTRCELYKSYTTEQAMLAAAATYGGLTD